jgi:hypothetical protein
MYDATHRHYVVLDSTRSTSFLTPSRCMMRKTSKLTSRSFVHPPDEFGFYVIFCVDFLREGEKEHAFSRGEEKGSFCLLGDAD